MNTLADFGLVPHDSIGAKPGDRFGRCLVIVTGKKPDTYIYRAVCQCDCGKVFAPMISGLRNGSTQSCGCKNREDTTKHGLWKSPLYPTWQHMLKRCNDPNDPKFADYGGRGITVCERWHDLRAFHEDMAPTFKRGLTLDRTDNSKGYSPENCAWREPAEQARNKRNNIWVTIEGRRMILKDWCVELGVSYGMARSRIKEMGWDPVEALRIPASPRIKVNWRG